MKPILSPFYLLVMSLAGYLNREQQKILDYLKAENAVLRQQLRGKRLRFNNHQRLALALKGKGWSQQAIMFHTSAAAACVQPCTQSCVTAATKSARILQGRHATHADAKWAYNATANAVATCVSDPARARTWGLERAAPSHGKRFRFCSIKIRNALALSC